MSSGHDAGKLSRARDEFEVSSVGDELEASRERDELGSTQVKAFEPNAAGSININTSSTSLTKMQINPLL